jgi:thiol-disulfide isomerase/thioredoxin
VISRPLSILATFAALAAGLTACGGDGSPAPAPAGDAGTSTVMRSTASVAPSGPLARNAADADTIAGAGIPALKKRLASLKGHPVVVNLWASWCGPCRAEFPHFAAAVRKHRAQVAFVGVDVMDSRDDAEAFLDEQPPGFASVYDAEGEAARSIGGGRAMPTTIYIGADGHNRYTKLGSYATAADLETDIRAYALGTA